MVRCAYPCQARCRLTRRCSGSERVADAGLYRDAIAG